MRDRIHSLWHSIDPRLRAYAPLIPACIILSCAWGAFQTYRAPVYYASTGRIVISGRINLADSNTYLEELNNLIGTQIEIIQSENLAARARQAMLSIQPSLNGAVSVKASWLRSTSIIMVSATGSEPNYTEAYLNALLLQFIESRSDRRIETSLDAMQKLRDEIIRAEKSLADQESGLFLFKAQHNMAYWERQSSDASQFLSELKIRAARLELKLRTAESLRANLASTASVQEKAEAAPTPATGPDRGAGLPALRRQLVELQIEREQLMAIYKPAHPRIKALDQDMTRQQKMLDLLLAEKEAALQAELAADRSELQSIQASIQDWESKALESTRTEAEYEKLQSAVTRTHELYSRLLNNLQSVSVGKDLTVDPVQILQTASRATKAERPLVENLRGAAGLGFLCGVGLVLLLSRIDPRAFSEAEISTRLAAEPLIEIPHIPEIADSPQVTSGQVPPPVLTEAARTLLASFSLHTKANSRAAVVLCVSTMPGEGKSTVAMHLAQQAAKTGIRTLLIDGDLRRGRLAERLGLDPNLEGLAELLESPARGWQSVIRPIKATGLDLITRGQAREKTIDCLKSWLNEQNMAELRRSYGLVVFDSAPLAPISDSLRFLSVVDRVLFVTRIKQTHLRLAERVARAIRSQHAGKFDLIVNSSPPRHSHGGYYGFEKYQSETPGGPNQQPPC
jgi:Mrp family chromosome partitioning ATPase/uncharacterized protein involved in exopolysaccharide biosynthesis